MSFRVRRAWLSGNCILQHSEGENWVDHYPTPDLETGFHIVGLEFMQDREALLEEQGTLIGILMGRIKLYERRAEIARKSRLKRKAPVLVEVIKVATELAIANDEWPEPNRGPYPRPKQ